MFRDARRPRPAVPAAAPGRAHACRPRRHGQRAVSADLRAPLQFIKGIGPRRAADLAGAGLHVLEDLLLKLPRRYDDREHVRPMAQLRSGETVSVVGNVLGAGERRTQRRGFRIFEAVVGDASGQVRAVFFNQSFLTGVLVPRRQVALFGTVEYGRTGGGLCFTNPEYEVLDGDAADDGERRVHTGRIVPIYERVGSVTPKHMRRIVHGCLERLPPDIDDPLPPEVRERRGLLARRPALLQAHFPEPGTSIDELNNYRSAAQRRLIFEEFFVFQLGLALKRRETDALRKPHRVEVDDRIRRAALDVLPFRLTGHQRQALREIVDDLRRPQPMNRLLQGDVGSGKTIVALLAALVAMENGLQAAFMAPTELLAEQHFLNITRLLEPSRFEPVLLTGALGAQKRREAWEQLAAGSAQLAVGTHALVQESVRFNRLGFAIIDEQHRFGVVQRATLRGKGMQPDVLVMTATPIPRTLALTAYGDLDVSIIRELPPGRQPVATRVAAEERRADIYRFLRGELRAGRQAYVVYPLVEESEKVDLKAATRMARHLEQDVFPDLRVGLVHGRLKPGEREAMMRAFAAGEIDLLVATTVIEVGVDVANASVMLIEHAERFGLAQLHQLRGRVGRGAQRAHCILLHGARQTAAARARLAAVAATTDGFEIAERDLEIRGPGDFVGTRQSGLPTLRTGDLLRDHRVMEDARQAVHDWLADQPPAATLDAAVAGWSERFQLAGVG